MYFNQVILLRYFLPAWAVTSVNDPVLPHLADSWPALPNVGGLLHVVVVAKTALLYWDVQKSNPFDLKLNFYKSAATVSICKTSAHLAFFSS